MSSPATQVTWEQIFGLVTDERIAVGAKELNPSAYRVRARQRMAEVFRAAKAYDTYWDNSASGALTVSGYEAALPVDCLFVERVEWDGSDNPLEIVSVQVLDLEEAGWREATATDPTRCVVTPRRILFNLIPDSPTTGKLVVRGYGVPDDSALLGYLPVDGPRHLAQGILSLCPGNPQNEAELALKAQAAREWEALGKPALVDAITVRRLPKFWY